jgi:sulfite exporter TauE/SafE
MIDGNEPLLASALLLGLFGSVHCLGMCGGIAAAFGQSGASGSRGAALGRTLAQSLGRITSYALAGAFVGGLGQAVAPSTGWVVALRVLAGLLIVGFGLHVAGIWNGIAVTERLGLGVWRRLAPLAHRLGRPDRVWKAVALGMLWGWLPCGLVYAALATAAVSGGASAGAAFMAVFGLGTFPALLTAGGFGAELGVLLERRAARRTAGALLLVFGLWAVVGGTAPLRSDAHESGDHCTGAPAAAAAGTDAAEVVARR